MAKKPRGITQIGRGIINHYRREFEIEDTETYPEELINQAAETQIAQAVFYLDTVSPPTIIPIDGLTVDNLAAEAAMKILNDLEYTSGELQFITNDFEYDEKVDQELLDSITAFSIGALHVLEIAQGDVAAMPHTHRQILNIALLSLQKHFHPLLYLAIRVDRISKRFQIFVYFDKKRQLLN